MTQPSASTKPVIFVDTSVLLRIQLFWDLAQWSQVISPESSGQLEYNKVEKALQKLPSRLREEIVMNGYCALSYLQRRQQDDQAQIYTSRLVRIEMLRAALEGALHQRLARWGIQRYPGRVGLPFGEPLRLYLPAKWLRRFVGGISELLTELKNRCLIDIWLIEDVRNYFQDALELAELLIQEVILDNVMDSFIYASALAVQANELITTDGKLRKMINHLHNPPAKSRWNMIHKQLHNYLSKRMSGSPEFPQSPQIQKRDCVLQLYAHERDFSLNR